MCCGYETVARELSGVQLLEGLDMGFKHGCLIDLGLFVYCRTQGNIRFRVPGVVHGTTGNKRPPGAQAKPIIMQVLLPLLPLCC